MNLDSASPRSEGAFPAPSFHLDELPVDVFEVGGAGLTVESLTGGHGMTETAASCLCGAWLCTGSCAGEQ